MSRPTAITFPTQPVPTPSPSTPAYTHTPPPTSNTAITSTTHRKRNTKPRKTLCEHGRRKTQCVDCYDLGVGGGSICKHRRRKDGCRECRTATPASAGQLLAARARKWLWNPPRPWEVGTSSAKTVDPKPLGDLPTCDPDKAHMACPPSVACSATVPTSTSTGTTSVSPSSLPSSRPDAILSTSNKRLEPPGNISSNPSSDEDLQRQARLRQLYFLRLQYSRSRIVAAAAWSAFLRAATPAPTAGYLDHSAFAAAAAAIQHQQSFVSSHWMHQPYAYANPGPWLETWRAHDPRLGPESTNAFSGSAPSTAAAVATHLSRSRAGAPSTPSA